MNAPSVQEYLQHTLHTCSHATLSSEDRDLITTEGMEEALFKKLSSKKYRKWKLDAESEQQIKGAIHHAVAHQQPLQFVFPFGGYKLWRLPTSPEPDWAEFFTCAYYAQWLAPVLRMYEPGAKFSFSSDDVIIERMDNVPVADTQAYFEGFKKLLSQFKHYFPDNFEMEIKRVGDFYQQDEFEAELATKVNEWEVYYQDFAQKNPEEYRQKLVMSELNINWQGVKPWGKLSENEKKHLITQGPIFHDAYCKLSKRRDFVRGADKIVVFPTPIPNAIALGTTKTSVTKFWTGIGVLEAKGDELSNRILSPKQWATAQRLPKTTVPITLLPLKNFSEIMVFDQPFSF